jgi:hypothetical protein
MTNLTKAHSSKLKSKQNYPDTKIDKSNKLLCILESKNTYYRITQVAIFCFYYFELFLMEWTKAPTELVDFINEKMKNKNCYYKKMFGYPTYFVMATCLRGFTATNCS